MTFRDIAANLANLNASYGRTPENCASGVTMGLLLRLHRESKKTRHQTLGHNFTNYYPIFRNFSVADSAVNLQQIYV